MLKILNKKEFEFDGSIIRHGEIDIKDFLMANISEAVSFSEELTIEELVEALLPLKDFVYSYFIENVEATLGALRGIELSRKPIEVVLKKELIISQEGEMMMHHRTHIEFDPDRKKGSFYLKDASISLDNSIDVVDQTASWSLDKKPFQGYNLIDVLDCVFSELYHALMSDEIKNIPLYTP